MLVFGHVGLTLGAAVLLNGVLSRSYARPGEGNDYLETDSGAVSVKNRFSSGAASWLTSLASRIDIRLLLLCSLLPDVIDKPIGRFFFRDTIGNGRIFSHTLLFAILIFFVGLYLYRSRGRLWLLVLAFGTFTHLVFDQMWRTLQTLLWPLYGFAFEKARITDWISSLLNALLTDPEVYLSELAGLAILIWFTWLVVRRGKLRAFLRNGEIR